MLHNPCKKGKEQTDWLVKEMQDFDPVIIEGDPSPTGQPN